MTSRSTRFKRGCATALPLLMAASACGSTDTQSSPADSSDTADASDTDTTDAGSETAESGAEGDLAEGIVILSVNANQGVEVGLTEGTDWVGGAERNAMLLRDRAMMIRVLFAVQPGWEAREIRAVLDLWNDGALVQQEQTLLVAGDPVPDDLTSHFAFLLDADTIAPDTEFQVRLYEVEAGRGVEVNADVVAPADPALVGAEDGTASIEIVLVPVEIAGCSANTVVDAQVSERVRANYVAIHPLQTADVTIDDPLVLAGSTVDSCGDEINTALGDRRTANGDADSTMYIGMYGPACAATPPQGFFCGCKADPGVRAYTVSGVTNIGSLQFCSGIALGRQKVECPGSSGSDTNYPYPDGTIGRPGFSVETREFFPSSTPSYLSDCSPGWVSDYGWNAVWDELVEP